MPELKTDFNMDNNSKEIADKLLTPVTDPVTSCHDLWDLLFGGFSTFVEKKRLSRLKDLSDFRSELFRNIEKIPKEKIIDPPLSIVGPALEASKFYYENEDLRTMFSRLISSSMSTDTSRYAHPSFISIIKELSPYDARLLKEILSPYFEKEVGYPMAKLCQSKDNRYQKDSRLNHFGRLRNGSDLFKNFIALENEYYAPELSAVSLSNMERLGLIEILYNFSLSEFSLYKPLEDSNFFKDYLKAFNNSKEEHQKDFVLFLNPGIICLTEYGKTFLNVCC